jgi:hypothetical protein
MRTSLIAGVLVTLSSAVSAAPPIGADPALAPWYRSLDRPDFPPHSGMPCCGQDTDCRELDEQDVKIDADGNYEFFTRRGETVSTFRDGRNMWVKVPTNKIGNRENPTGHDVACWAAIGPGDGFVYCFFPAAKS